MGRITTFKPLIIRLIGILDLEMLTYALMYVLRISLIEIMY